MLRIQLRRSRMLASVLVIAHAFAMTVVLLLGIPLWLECLMIAILFANLAYSIWKAALLLSSGAIIAVTISSDHVLSVQTRGGDYLECEVSGDTCVAAFLVIIIAREILTGVVRTAVILPDSINEDDFRALRVWLRWKPDPRSSASV